MLLDQSVYGLDTTGSSRDNRVIDETHTLANKPVRVIVPFHGAFYKDSVVVRQKDSTITLNKNQYSVVHMHEAATAAMRQPITTMILITDSTLNGELSIDYQAVGGEYSSFLYPLEEVVSYYENLTGPVLWDAIVDKPDGFKPAPHLHDIGDIHGFEILCMWMQQIVSTIEVGAKFKFSWLVRRAEFRIQTLEVKLEGLRGLLNNHENKFNAHNESAARLGVQTANIVSIRIKDAVTAFLLELQKHKDNFNNPHLDTAASVGIPLEPTYNPTTTTNKSTVEQYQSVTLSISGGKPNSSATVIAEFVSSTGVVTSATSKLTPTSASLTLNASGTGSVTFTTSTASPVQTLRLTSTLSAGAGGTVTRTNNVTVTQYVSVPLDFITISITNGLVTSNGQEGAFQNSTITVYARRSPQQGELNLTNSLNGAVVAGTQGYAAQTVSVGTQSSITFSAVGSGAHNASKVVPIWTRPTANPRIVPNKSTYYVPEAVSFVLYEFTGTVSVNASGPYGVYGYTNVTTGGLGGTGGSISLQSLGNVPANVNSIQITLSVNQQHWATVTYSR